MNIILIIQTLYMLINGKDLSTASERNNQILVYYNRITIH